MKEVSEKARQNLEDLLTFFGVNTSVAVEIEENTIYLNVESDQGGRLIGHRGETLSALQHILNMMVRSQTEERIYVQVDVGGYKKARAERLVAKAREVADKVEETGEEITLPPMSPGERRQVHMALAQLEGVETESRGDDSRRRLVVKKRS